jgi:hypothetical protein
MRASCSALFIRVLIMLGTSHTLRGLSLCCFLNPVRSCLLHRSALFSALFSNILKQYCWFRGASVASGDLLGAATFEVVAELVKIFLLRCYAVMLGGQSAVFRGHCDPSKCRELLPKDMVQHSRRCGSPGVFFPGVNRPKYKVYTSL